MGPSENDATVAEAILLHLLENRTTDEEMVVPLSATQAGISRDLGLRQSHVSYELQNLMERGLVEEGTRHVKGEKRRRKAYWLSSAGHREASGLKLAWTGRGVRVAGSGEDGERTIQSIMNEHAELSIALIVKNVHEGGLDLGPLVGDGDEGSMPELQEERPFLGREREMQSGLDWLGNASSRALVVTGMPGIGKTTFAVNLIATADIPVFYTACNEWTTVNGVLAELAGFLRSRERHGLHSYLGTKPAADPEEAFARLEADLGGLEVVLVFDDIHKCDITRLLRALLVQEAPVKFLAIGREVHHFYSRQDAAVEGTVKEMMLRGLDREAGLRLLNRRRLEGDLEALYEAVEGHPLCLELVTDENDLCLDSEAAHYLGEEVIEGLGEEEANALYFLSIHRYPVERVALLDEGVKLQTLDHLVQRGFVRSLGDRYDIHEMIKEFITARMPSGQASALHRKAAAHYVDASQDRGLVEAAYHLVMAGEPEEGARLCVENRYLISEGEWEGLLALTSLILGRGIEDDVCKDVLLLRFDIMVHAGMWGAAREVLEEAGGLGHEPGAELLYRSGILAYRTGSNDAAQNALELALAQVEAGEPIRADIQNLLGILRWEAKDLEGALDLYRQALATHEENGDRAGTSKMLNNIGLLLWSQGKLDEALVDYQKAMRIALKIGDKRMASSLLANMGDLYKDQGKEGAARTTYTESLEMASAIGYRWQEGEAHRCLGALLGSDEGAAHLDAAMTIFRELGAGRDMGRVQADMESSTVQNDEQ